MMEPVLPRIVLPSLSGLTLLVPALLALRRSCFPEAVSFCFTALFETFFHACDGPTALTFCLLRFELLEYFSIYGLALSMWLSVLGVARLAEPRRGAAVMLGALTCGLRVAQQRHGYGVYSGPLGSAICLVAVTFLREMRRRRKLYPDRRVYLFHVAPGCCVGSFALVLRFFMQDYGYAYIHSAHHICLAITFAFLLPSSGKTTLERPRLPPRPGRLQCQPPPRPPPPCLMRVLPPFPIALPVKGTGKEARGERIRETIARMWLEKRDDENEVGGRNAKRNRLRWCESREIGSEVMMEVDRKAQGVNRVCKQKQRCVQTWWGKGIGNEGVGAERREEKGSGMVSAVLGREGQRERVLHQTTISRAIVSLRTTDCLK
uniref:protein myomaker-like n=1 Tax=Myxine glutinosa TaxID=7769 RepID=UPI00358E5339